VSEIAGNSIRYRIVSPNSGKMMNIKKIKDKVRDNLDKLDKKNTIHHDDVIESYSNDDDSDVDDDEE
jgi:sugar-specific transcriptional regulator TrmB